MIDTHYFWSLCADIHAGGECQDSDQGFENLTGTEPDGWVRRTFSLVSVSLSADTGRYSVRTRSAVM